MTLDILTGLIGPKGCGKSNVVDALRWAMGEGSARTLHGADMENVCGLARSRNPFRHESPRGNRLY